MPFKLLLCPIEIQPVLSEIRQENGYINFRNSIFLFSMILKKHSANKNRDESKIKFTGYPERKLKLIISGTVFQS
ncbi:MAG: hypothetical protein B6D37_09160 [Sphingobacteriales bacterium UTBCD1]|nr:MAG: hypothetical protein B6D37_09160 [Sphingobacteriales bacterium UTBCD1]